MISVVIVTWNVAGAVLECLASLQDQPLVRGIVVVDNASADRTAERVAAAFPAVHLIRNPANVGFARACNQGIDALDPQDDVLLLNPDARAGPGALEALERCLASEPRAGAAGPRLLHPDGSLQPNGGPFPSLAATFCRLTRLSRIWRRGFDRRFRWGRDNLEAAAAVDQVSGACLLVRRAALEEVGGLDEQFFMYYEEVDWLRRARARGWECRFAPEARVYHRWAASTGQVASEALAWMADSEYRYFRKHGPAWQRPIAWLLTRLELASHRLARWVRARGPGPASACAGTDIQ